MWKDAADASSATASFEAKKDLMSKQFAFDSHIVRYPAERSGELPSAIDSRSVVAALVEGMKEFCPAQDALFIRSEAFEEFTNGSLYGHLSVRAWACKLRHIAIQVPVPRLSERLAPILVNLLKLETITIIFPRSSSSHVVSNGIYFQPLSEEAAAEMESEGHLVNNDWGDLYHGMMHVQLATQIKDFRANLVKYTAARSGRGWVPSWSSIWTRRAKLRIQAGQTVQSPGS
ncbi:hypothetical protein HJFPF1_07720 [Paramyrothecium foliicola]|nr:hypothetical protein HJFPF1_07720 [Paramyrothecium foliicola]